MILFIYSVIFGLVAIGADTHSSCASAVELPCLNQRSGAAMRLREARRWAARAPPVRLLTQSAAGSRCLFAEVERPCELNGEAWRGVAKPSDALVDETRAKRSKHKPLQLDSKSSQGSGGYK